MAHWTHTLKIEVVDLPTNKKIEADCEFNTDGTASFKMANYDAFDGLTIEQNGLLTNLVDLIRRIQKEFGELAKVKIEEIP